MTILAATATQLSRSVVQIGFVDPDQDTQGYQIRRTIGGILMALGTIAHSQRIRTFTDDTIGDVAIGDVAEYVVRSLDAGQFFDAPFLTIGDPDVPWTYGPPRADADAPRYTSLETVRRRLRIPATETGFDEDLEEAVIASEIALDFELGRSFPDTGSNPQYPFVPRSIAMICTAAAIAVYKAADAPFGTAGAEEWFGAQSVADVAAQSIRRNPLIRGFQVSFGTG